MSLGCGIVLCTISRVIVSSTLGPITYLVTVNSDNYVSYGLNHVEWTLNQNGNRLVTSMVSMPLLHQWGYLAKKVISFQFTGS